MNGSPATALGARPAALVLLALLVGQGCAGFAARDGSAGEDTDRIAQNLVYTLAQLDESNPLTTTVQVSEPVTPFGRDVVRLIRESGYGIQSVPDDRGGNYLRYSVRNTASELGAETRYAVSIGDVSVQRAYDEVDGRLVPVSAQRVEGSASRWVELNDDVFGVELEPAAGVVVYDDELAPTFTDSTGAALPDVAGAGAAPDPAAGSATSGASAFGARVKQNLYDGLGSNYAELFESYDDVSTAAVSFPNDSMRLGDEQKRIIERYAAELRPGTDLLSVVGCSHGNTAIRNGNSVLALGRANRVKEALVYAGVAPGAVLDEGCWAGSAHEIFPKRGVVLTLKRRTG